MATPPIPWRGRYEPGVPQGLPAADRSFSQLLVEAAGAAPGQTALVYYRRRTSYAQLNARVSSAAQAFRRFGLQRGDRVAVALPNAPGTCDVLLGIMRAGGVVLALPAAAPTAGLRATLADHPPRLAITWSGARKDLRAALAAVAPLVMVDPIHDLPLLPRVMARLGGLTGRGAAGRESRGSRMPPWERFIRGAKASDESTVGAEDPALEVALAGGGTVGFNHAQLVSGAVMLRAWLADTVPGEDSWLPLLPLTSPFGLITVLGAAPLARARVLLLPHWDGAVITDLSRWMPIAYAFADGATMLALGNDPHLPEADLGSVRGWIVGDPLAVQDRAAFEAATGLDVCQGLAPADAAGLLLCNPVNGHREPDSLGLLLPGVAARTHPGASGRGQLELCAPNMAGSGWQRLNPPLVPDSDGYIYVDDAANPDRSKPIR